jgi:hypothetical protein
MAQRVLLSQLGNVAAELLRQISKGAVIAEKWHCVAVAQGSQVTISAIVVPDGYVAQTLPMQQITETDPGQPGTVTVTRTQEAYNEGVVTTHSGYTDNVADSSTQQESGQSRENSTFFYEESSAGSGTVGVQSGVA